MSVSPTHRDTARYPGGELAREPRSGAAGGKEPAQRLKTQAGPIRPARALQELRRSQTGNGQVWLNLSLQLPREELAPKGSEQSVESEGERGRTP